MSNTELIRSCLYQCTVMHHRLHPKKHRFQHDIFMFYLNLDELPEIQHKVRGFSLENPNLYCFKESDHLPDKNCHLPLKERVIAFLAANGEARACKTVMLLTNVRMLGYVFNPVSFYFCFDEAGGPICAVAEVGNTFDEKKPYLIPLAAKQDASLEDVPSRFHLTMVKQFYVSPFSELLLKFDFNVLLPNAFLNIAVNDLDESNALTLLTTLTGKRRLLTSGELLRMTVWFPLVTLKIITLIHLHALWLCLKGTPFFNKEDHPAHQQNVLNPHRSLSVTDALLADTAENATVNK